MHKIRKKIKPTSKRLNEVPVKQWYEYAKPPTELGTEECNSLFYPVDKDIYLQAYPNGEIVYRRFNRYETYSEVEPFHGTITFTTSRDNA